MAGQRRSIARRSVRQRRREVYIFAEGEKTEPGYFDAIKRLQDRYTIKVHDQHGAPREVLDLAMNFKDSLVALSRDLPEDEQPIVCCVFDRDQHPGVDDVIRRAARAGIRVGFSNPCFELWLLLHFQDFGAPCAGSCGTVHARLVKHVPDYVKTLPFELLRGRFESARDRAMTLATRHANDGIVVPTRCDPSTDVHRLLTELGLSY